MDYRKSLFFNALELPAYWRACRRARANLAVPARVVPYGKHPRQYAVVLRPPNARAGRLAFYFHGGGWTFGRPETFLPAAEPWLRRGFTVVLPSYRRPPVVGLRGVVNDCWAAVASFATPEVTELHLGGISAGAHLAALLALAPERWLRVGFGVAPSRALLCAGPLWLTSLWPGVLFRRYAALDPYRRLGPDTPTLRWLLLHGTADGLVGYHHSAAFHQRLLRVGQPADLLTISGGTHLDAGRWMFGGPGADAVNAFISQ